jgi:murein DD-endopeptidase MepM/ murein hydrolase activator NlpD
LQRRRCGIDAIVAPMRPRFGLPLALLLLALPVRAQTPPASGAVAKPASLCIRAPFQDGERVRVSSGYGPNGGSGYHDGTMRTCCANDYHALDLVLMDRESNGLGQPVVAVANGTVVLAGQATEGWASYGNRVVVAHEHNDGHSYASMYAHMDTVTVSEGQTVRAGDQVGTLGGSSNGSQTGTAYHLHFAFYQDSLFGGSGTGGAYSGHAVVPEPLGDTVDLIPGTELVASGCQGGDGDGDGEEPPSGGVDEIGFCSASGASGTLGAWLLLALIVARRRR